MALTPKIPLKIPINQRAIPKMAPMPAKNVLYNLK